MVDAFRITLSKGYDDNNKKYIDTLMKLDNSKTVILETKWIDIRIKNTGDIAVKKWETWTAEFSDYAQEGTTKIYIDYPELWNVKEGTVITCQQSKPLRARNATPAISFLLPLRSNTVFIAV